MYPHRRIHDVGGGTSEPRQSCVHVDPDETYLLLEGLRETRDALVHVDHATLRSREHEVAGSHRKGSTKRPAPRIVAFDVGRIGGHANECTDDRGSSGRGAHAGGC